MNIEQRMAIERLVIQKLLDTARLAGWSVPCVYDGQDNVPCSTDQDVLDAVFSVDECHIRVCKRFDVRTVPCTVFIVLGNDGWDCICDHSTKPEFLAEVMDPLDDWIDAEEEKA